MRGITRTRRMMGKRVSALLHQGFKGRARCMTRARGAACVCAQFTCAGGSVDYYDDPVGVYLCVRVLQ